MSSLQTHIHLETIRDNFHGEKTLYGDLKVKTHTHISDKMVWWFRIGAQDGLNLGAQVEVSNPQPALASRVDYFFQF